ncbi:hypothetical protein WDU94_002299 [Cyamophila willieti]
MNKNNFEENQDEVNKKILENEISKDIINNQMTVSKKGRKKGEVRKHIKNDAEQELIGQKTKKATFQNPEGDRKIHKSKKTLSRKDHFTEMDPYYGKWKNVVQELELEKATRMEVERAFKNLMELYEEKHRKLIRVSESSKQGFDIAAQMKDKYAELRKITEETETKLKDANDTVNILEQILTAERRKADKLKHDLKPPKQTEPTQNPLSEELETEKKEKENALTTIKEQCEQIKEIENEREVTKRKCKEMKEKMVEILKINTELGVQNEILEKQRNSFQCLLKDKDEQVQRFLAMDVMKNPRVIHKINDIIKICENQEKKWIDKMATLNRNIEDMRKINTELKEMVDSRNLQLSEICREHEALKRKHDDILDRFEGEVTKNENGVLTLMESTKTIKNELIKEKHRNKDQKQKLDKLKEKIRVKDTEIAVLTEAKDLYEDKIKVYLCEADCWKENVIGCKREIEEMRLAIKNLGYYKCALEKQLEGTRNRLHQERETKLIQEKILEDNRDTMNMLKTKLKQCCQQKYKCEREKQILLVERGCCC